MAKPYWPEDLPQDWYNDSGPQYAPVDNTIRSQVTAGPAKLRRRFTAQTEDVTLSNELTEVQLGRLKCFVKDALGEVGRFAWKDFRTNQYAEYRFKAGWSSVKTQHLGGDFWTVNLDLELMP